MSVPSPRIAAEGFASPLGRPLVDILILSKSKGNNFNFKLIICICNEIHHEKKIISFVKTCFTHSIVLSFKFTAVTR